MQPEEENVSRGRREYDDADIVDTTYKLTFDEVIELKKIAQLSKMTKTLVFFFMGVVSFIGIPSIFSWIQRHFTW